MKPLQPHTVRGVREQDVPALLALAETAGQAFTSLPADGSFIAARVEASRRGEAPLMAMEDPSGAVVGVSGLVRRVGTGEPWYAYRLETRTVQSHALGFTRDIATLHLEARHHGPTEVGTLLLHPGARGSAAGLGRLLSGCRYLFMRRDLAGFADTTLAELRPPVRPDGGNAFWDAIGDRYFGLGYTAADRLSATDKRFIAELMPRQPIDVCLLSDEAQAVIGQVMPETLPARRMLEREGFAFADAVDIFDAGPVFSCATREIRSVRDAVERPVEAAGPGGDAPPTHLVARASGPFRCVLAAAEVGDVVRLPPAALDALQVSVGDAVHATPR
ncbi:arginine N-succinyltransferase [Phycisphaera mikurensis]|uniref:Arginine N-succinyltransferase n=1 Tax=Phycisphaera mikurensis (strain NBRC 102666 / KCTC 22515 / FYK2301M01) TaxID=1142394 RepID=I0IF80_PHYMF|nr:arginine N-succinyltransferase [Phycisphaera mikurensis]MBB6440686.1 arginine N-succinyltransferase [Phycisphaera mikurensis]BAM03918.1 arginine N-succinyltransferase [Phycisphaera mikurensis NBRC 102666]